ncbi:hypothetical protein [Gynuella sunshinyii]|uniref:Outer membrane protein beta-barrel domain-containing protein n=2 Tax=Gynuella sunshinyii TaxID=1445505 RepID=A0A0C5VES2_9GAMM|nr:hypothetical protein [Gynuella sunshinyii]AII80604.1 iron-regulated outer membrane protein [Gynuella sunshinyii YC6258]AJQ93072.1 hypothetical Protein YC6258_01022 [Gynuella sunshinyii YC6258]
MKVFKPLLLLAALLGMGGYTQASGQLKPFGEFGFIGPYGVGIGAGAFYDKPEMIQYIKGFWGGAALLLDDETDNGYGNYTESVLDFHGGISFDSRQIPGLDQVEKLTLFTGLSVAFRDYEHQGENRSRTMFGPVVGAVYEVSQHWTLGGMLSTTTNDPRLIFSYSF